MQPLDVGFEIWRESIVLLINLDLNCRLFLALGESACCPEGEDESGQCRDCARASQGFTGLLRQHRRLLLDRNHPNIYLKLPEIEQTRRDQALETTKSIQKLINVISRAHLPI